MVKPRCIHPAAVRRTSGHTRSARRCRRRPHMALPNDPASDTLAPPAPDAQEEDVRFYVQQFIRARYRGRAHLDNDFRRFATAHRIGAGLRRRVRRRLEMLLDDAERSGAT